MYIYTDFAKNFFYKPVMCVILDDTLDPSSVDQAHNNNNLK